MSGSESALQPSPAQLQGAALAQEILRVIIEQRALDPRGLAVGPLTSIADYFVLGSGTSERHVCGIADKIKQQLSRLGASPPVVSGYDNGEWVLLDYGDVIAHIFYEPVRHYYNLDQLWGDAETLAINGELAPQAEKLRTGMF